MGADYVATGHYAQNYKINSLKYGGVSSVTEETPPYSYLMKGVDASKDQSYFLWTLKQEQLNKILFPIGHLKKTEVRKLAKKFKLPVAEKKDSQGICFLGAIDLKNFLKHYIKEKRGEVVLVPSEAEGEKHKVIGYHNGIMFYTLGERHGFIITQKSPNDGRYYVVGKDIKKNILTVSQNSPLLMEEGVGGGDSKKPISPQPSPYKGEGEIQLKNTNWISDTPEPDKRYTAQIRYHGEFLSCTIKCGRQGLAQIMFQKSVMVAGGQSCVIYDKDICLGGGVIV
jgi:tRNA-specific 2-thiouridylase